MPYGIQFGSVRTRLLTWFLFIAILPLLMVTVIIYFQQVATIKREAMARLEVIRDLKALQVDEWLLERQGDLRILAEDFELRLLCQHRAGEMGAEGQVDGQGPNELLRNYDRHFESFESLELLDGQGKVMLSSSGAPIGSDLRQERAFEESLRTGGLFIDDIHAAKDGHTATMTFSSVVRCLDHEGAHIVGVVLGHINLDASLYPLLLNRTGMGQTGETLIVSRKQLALSELRWHEQAPLRLVISAEPAKRAAHGEHGTIEADDYRGEPVLASYTHIPSMGWGLIAKQDLSELHQPIDELLWRLVGLLALSSAVVVGLAFVLARAVTTPLLDVSKVARAFQRGDLDARCELGGEDEVATLAVTLNGMASSVSSRLRQQQEARELFQQLVDTQTTQEFARVLINRFMAFSGATIGACYLRSEDGERFEPIHSVGLDAAAPQGFSASLHEGELGLALATGRPHHLRELPADSRFVYKAMVGSLAPRELLTIPLVVADDVLAVLCLATLSSFADELPELVTLTRNGMGATLSGLLSREKEQRLAGELAATNEELAATNEELAATNEELAATNEEAIATNDELTQQTKELEAQRAKAELADRLKGEFLSNMSHELRTPLNSILALSQLLLDEGTGSDPQADREALGVIERNGRQLLALINDLLDLSRIEAGQTTIELERVELQVLGQELLATVRPMIPPDGPTLELSVAEEASELRSDPGLLRQILLNLLSNAIKFTPGGSVRLDISLQEQDIRFEVSDTGIGIPAADQEVIFDEFRQLDGSTTRRFGGTGLGLAISRRLARLMGGDILVRSEPAAGSTFTLVLPIEPGSKPSDGVPEGSPVRPPEGRAPEVLVVEDEPIAAQQLERALRSAGFGVTLAPGGAQALALLECAKPDALVLDLMMPGMDGFQVVAALRELPDTAQLPILVLTAKALTAGERARLKSGNIQQLIVKGTVNRAQLIQSVRRLVGLEGGEPPAQVPTGEPMRPRGGRRSGGASRILVVEDNEDNLLTITRLLERHGYLCLIARDGEEGVRAAQQYRPELVLMDIQLPGLSGLDATRRIKADPVLAAIPVVAVTARAMAGDRDGILAAGCDAIVHKPIDWNVLGQEIQRQLGRDTPGEEGAR